MLAPRNRVAESGADQRCRMGILVSPVSSCLAITASAHRQWVSACRGAILHDVEDRPVLGHKGVSRITDSRHRHPTSRWSMESRHDNAD